ncbi:TPA: hypothetical protein ACH3X1_000925 [Trebouxia sp. C0004]
MDEGLKLAHHKYFKAVVTAARGLKSHPGPSVVASGIPPALFEAWSGKQESRWKLAYETVGGRVLVYGDPSRVHDKQLDQRSRCRGRWHRREDCGEDIFGSGRQSSLSVYSPTLVGEVAYVNEYSQELQRELTGWTATDDLAQMSSGYT